MADVIITPASGLIDFQNTSGISSATIQLDGNGNLNISAAAGDIEIGDTASDIFIGDGVANVDIVFEEDGEIRGLTGKTITFGQSDSFLAFAGEVTGDVNLTDNLNVTGVGTFAELDVGTGGIDVDGHTELDTLNVSIAATTASLTLANAGVAVTAILDEDGLTSNRDDALATQQSIKAYVDSQVPAQDLDIQGDTGGALSIDLDSETLTIAGTTNEIETSGSGNTIAVGLPNDVTISNDLTVSGDLNVSGISTFQDDVNIGTATTGVVVRPDGTLNVSGNLGIGTTNPQYKLQVTGGGIDLNSSSTSSSNGIRVGRFIKGHSGQKLVISNDGNTGILLEGTTDASLTVSANGIVFGSAPIKFYSSDWTIYNNPTITLGGSNQSANIVGNIGLGSTQPTAKLDVNGTVNVSGVITATSFSGELHTTSLLKEEVNITAGKLSDNTDIDVANGMVHYFSTQETTTSTPNIRYDASNTLNSKMNVGETIAVSIITTCAAAGYSTAISIDGTTQTVKWNGGSLPSAGGSSGNDIYSFQTLKTGANTYIVFGSLTNFAAG